MQESRCKRETVRNGRFPVQTLGMVAGNDFFVCNFWPERLKKFHFASIHVCPISDYDMLTEGRSARDLLRKKIAS